MKRIFSLIVSLLLMTVLCYAQDSPLKAKILPLNGKLVTYDDSSEIGTAFSVLQNMRYTDTHIKSIGGMTKINTSPNSTYINARNGFHFSKYQPAESHLILHAYSSGNTSVALIDNVAVVPAQGNFSATNLYSLASTHSGSFSLEPNGSMFFANGDETLVWSGNEMPVGSFVTSASQLTGTSSVLTSANDYTSQVTNTLSTPAQVATVGNGLDSYVKLLLHMDGTNNGTTFADSSASAHAMTAVQTFITSTAQIQFGTSSAYSDGAGGYLGTPDHTDFALGSTWTIDFWVNVPNNISKGFFSKYQDANNYYSLRTTGSGATINLEASFGGTAFNFNWNNPGLAGAWHHVALVSNANSYALYVDGTATSLASSSGVAASISSITGDFKVGKVQNPFITAGVNGYIDEFRLSKGIARWTANFTPLNQPYGTNAPYFLIGTKRPLQGAKFYISSANALTSTMTATYWNGVSWTSLAITDNTASGGVSLAQTGTVTWPSTVGTAQPFYVNGLSLYWYQFSLSAGSASIYYVTADAPMQPIVNIWDGTELKVAKTLYYNASTYIDYTLAVSDDSKVTYADLSSMTTSMALYVGFLDPQQGIDISLVDSMQNTSASTQMSVYYWNGAAWIAVGALNDATANSTTSLSQGGVVSWQGVTPGTESKRSIANESPLYYYKVVFAGTLSATVQVAEIRGIPLPPIIKPYTIATTFQNRAILLNNKNGNHNELLFSAYNTPDVWNGTDSSVWPIGDESDITAAANLSLVLTDAIEQLILTKIGSTYRIFGNGPTNWQLQQISGTIGCVAPQTMRTANLPLETGGGAIGKVIAIWQGADGLYITDGKTPSPIHGDIKDLFDKRNTGSINWSKVGDSVGFLDEENLEYHWIFASGNSTTLNREFVYDLRRWKWYEITRATGKKLQSGFIVHDIYGNSYNYGTLDTGYMYRLENGNDFDGSSIVSTFQLGDIALADNPLYETRAQYVNLGMVAKTVTNNLVQYTHYVDTKTVGTTFTMSPKASGKRDANVVLNINSDPGVFHSPLFSMTTNNEVIGFEPLYLGYFYKVEREHLR